MLSKILEHLNIDIQPPLDKLPPSDKSVSIGSVNVALYGELLGGEKEMHKRVVSGVMPVLTSIQNLYTALGNPSSNLTELTAQLQTGKVVVDVKESVEIDYTMIAQDKLADLAQRAGVVVFDDLDLIIDGELNPELRQIAVEYLEKWANNGFTGQTVVDVANAVLLKQTPQKTVSFKTVSVDAESLLKQCNLTWQDLFVFQSLESELFFPLVLVYYRTGIDQFNPFDLVTLSQGQAALRVLQKEIGLEDEPGESVAINENMQTDNAGGEEQPPLESEESTVIPDSPKPKRRSTTAKEK